MTISFDLDDTLIPGTKSFPVEKQNWLQKILGIEPLRAGTIQLMKYLRSQGYYVCIYTTSFRSPLAVWIAFRSYGISLHHIVNQKRHDKVLKERKNMISKYPPAFGIDLHVDDSPGVSLESRKFKFSTIIVDETDVDWNQKILDAIKMTPAQEHLP